MATTFPSRAPIALLGLAMSLVSFGCESDNLLSGVWRSTQAATGDLVIEPASGFNAVGVELVVGH
ncbi:MAG: hypothetical protein CMH53_00685, partial [Myxococcales bacterium]|nr:hypothetical protein [Myxococcales bacterium]